MVAWILSKIFPSAVESSPKEEAKKMRKFLPQFLKPEALQKYIGIMDMVTQRHFPLEWENKDQVVVFPLAKSYTFKLACRLFLSIDDSSHIARFSRPFDHIASGIFTIPVDLPGTPFDRAIKASKFIRTELVAIIDPCQLASLISTDLRNICRLAQSGPIEWAMAVSSSIVKQYLQVANTKWSAAN
ncbi:hypothetical protein SADUNF_Sadunf06G0054100 [Salix dunnii]|uniref:Uncharacterized protein n=1 Tax=Salix dunnii TaxID=1413687 RepID=A0A835K2Q9_9ROSI|nr:hypothetical protein SADUNF_Sadunf06G0054100 [Salix dunnii]